MGVPFPGGVSRETESFEAYRARDGCQALEGSMASLTDAAAEASCGQGPACRMETGMLRAILEKLQRGEGLTELVPQVEKVVSFAKGKGLCSFIGMPGPPILSALRLFPEDFEAHLQQKRCPAA